MGVGVGPAVTDVDGELEVADRAEGDSTGVRATEFDGLDEPDVGVVAHPVRRAVAPVRRRRLDEVTWMSVRPRVSHEDSTTTRQFVFHCTTSAPVFRRERGAGYDIRTGLRGSRPVRMRRPARRFCTRPRHRGLWPLGRLARLHGSGSALHMRLTFTPFRRRGQGLRVGGAAHASQRPCLAALA